MIYKRSIFLVLLLFVVQNAVNGQQAGQADSADIQIRTPSQQQIANYAEDEAFQYDNTLQEPESMLDKMMFWILQQISEWLDNATTKTFLEILLYIGFTALIILLINQYLKGNMSGIFLGREHVRPDTFAIQQNDSDNQNLDRLIQQAIDASQFRMATRYLYQKSLQQLQKEGYINWKKNKTNHDYLYEIKQNDLREVFREVTHYYEYTEYGNFAISESDFQKVYNRFKEIRTLIQSRS